MSCVLKRSVGQESEYAAAPVFAFSVSSAHEGKLKSIEANREMDLWQEAGTVKASEQLDCYRHCTYAPTPPAAHGKRDRKDFLLGLMFTDYAHSKINSFWDICRG